MLLRSLFETWEYFFVKSYIYRNYSILPLTTKGKLFRTVLCYVHIELVWRKEFNQIKGFLMSAENSSAEAKMSNVMAFFCAFFSFVLPAFLAVDLFEEETSKSLFRSGIYTIISIKCFRDTYVYISGGFEKWNANYLEIWPTFDVKQWLLQRPGKVTLSGQKYICSEGKTYLLIKRHHCFSITFSLRPAYHTRHR